LRGLIKTFRRLFSGLRDPRQRCPALQHDFAGVVSLAAMAMVCGANGPTAIAAFGANIGPRVFRATRLVRVPSHDTIGRVLAQVDADALDRAVQSGQAIVAARQRRDTERRHRGDTGRRHRRDADRRQRLRRVALDGKVTRGSASPARGQQAAAVVNAWDIDHKRTVATVAFPGPGQEIAAARALLQRPDLDLTGTLVSLDALHCNQETRDLIRRRGGDWLLPVKGNQPALQAAIARQFPAVPPADALRSEERGHGRHDIRIVETVTDPRVVQEIAAAHACEGLATLGRITYHSTQRGKEPTTETCLFICARRLRPRAFRAAVREHWGVEASLHNRLDVGMGEDACRVRVGMGPAIFAILRRQALNVIDSLRQPTESVPAAIERLKWWFARGVPLHAAA
jgi:predicted transposase YbfD/YdcC